MMGVEPLMQPLTGETLHFATANNEDGAHVNVFASGFWGYKHQKAFLISKCLMLMLPTCVFNIWWHGSCFKRLFYKTRFPCLSSEGVII